MDMSNLTIDLVDGFKVGDATHMQVEIRKLNLGEMLDVMDKAEKLVQTPAGYELIATPARIEFYQILKMLSLPADPDAIVTENLLKRMSANDYNIILLAMISLERAEINKGSEKRGRDITPAA